MKLFPYRQFEIETYLSAEDALFRLQEITVQSSDSFQTKLFPKNKSFRGNIYSNQFELRLRGFFYEKYHYRPIMTGTVQETEDGCVVKGDIQTSPWLKAVFFLMLIALPLVALTDMETFLSTTVIFLCIFLVYLGFRHLLFIFPANKSIEVLEEILQ